MNYIHNNNILNFIYGCISYLCILVLLVYSIRKYGLVWSNTAWDGWSTLATAGVGIALLNERPTMQQYIGILFTGIGIILLGFKGTSSVTGK